MRKQTILFDLDDTLIHCNKYFDDVLDQFADLMTTWFNGFSLQADEIKRKQYEFDSAGVHKLGFVADHFPDSLVQTYDHYTAVTGREPSETERKRLYDLGKSVYEFPDIEPYPNMAETLEHLRVQGHELFLYTGGESAIQHKKVKQMGLDAFFGDRLFVSSHKTTAVLESILSKHRFDRAKTWMIGNSLRTDVLPALETGINAIHIPAITEWQFNVIDIDVKPKRAFLRLPKLMDVPPAIERYSLV
ncbi:HAD family hydrolase [Paenibacillus flagellatus]|uniref:HAD family hydrolase n=1 Tax=Paenibacillus flagellatus TaxID=2211139 RepID=A0A2V5JVV3_9BACL|nr:HAD family hydrolase [Paenibacillus flagellatus]PYI50641.1 HAD family hydrolase [Paenibacillus flagellatus]